MMFASGTGIVLIIAALAYVGIQAFLIVAYIRQLRRVLRVPRSERAQDPQAQRGQRRLLVYLSISIGLTLGLELLAHFLPR